MSWYGVVRIVGKIMPAILIKKISSITSKKLIFIALYYIGYNYLIFLIYYVRSPFGKFTNRRHHCRLCGKVVCGRKSCSSQYPLSIEDIQSSKFTNIVNVEEILSILVCKPCQIRVNRRQDAQKENEPSHIEILYDALIKQRRIVEKELPKFNEYVISLRSKKSISPDDLQYVLAERLRKKLLDAFTQIDSIG